MKCDREQCALRLERLAASAKILAGQLRSRAWYSEVAQAARQVEEDARFVNEQVAQDSSWAAGDR